MDLLPVRLFASLFGVLLGLSLLKFGNPCVMAKYFSWPTNIYEWAIDAWPVTMGYWLLGLVALVGISVVKPKISTPRWLVVLPLIWLVWQLIAATHTEDAALTRVTLAHFTACAVCFYLGLFALSQVRDLNRFWVGLIGAFIIVLAVGLRQHFGGLEESRHYFLTYIYPGLKEVPPEFFKKMTSSRIFSTLFYPNTLAGALLLFLPMVLVLVGRDQRLALSLRTTLVACIGAAAMACLYWSGSKGGWLLMLLLGMVVLLRLKFERKWKIALVALVFACGLTGFTLRFSGYFKKGATSLGARFDYWRAAVETVQAKPLWGTGPGTFAIAYSAVKKPEWEMSRMTHNDYLEQASDSGMPGFVSYAFAIVGILVWTGRKAVKADDVSFAVWLGVLGWGLQSFMEFGLYIPALAWPAFGLMGWLLGSLANQFDKPKAAV